MYTLYGISNCDTVRKARKWLEEHGIKYCFHDFRKEGTELELLKSWVEELGLEQLLNTRGTTWRKIPESKKKHLSPEKAVQLMQEFPSVIKRPVLDTGQKRHLGFSGKAYENLDL